MADSRTPYGVRGLKSSGRELCYVKPRSHPIRGAWIEITTSLACPQRLDRSHPIRGAWIEINYGIRDSSMESVAPHTGCVD